LKIENYQLADIIFPYLHISIFPSPEGEASPQPSPVGKGGLTA
jgi:hypothetical protein